MVDRAGERFADYRLVRRLGGGTFGDVYLGENTSDKTPAAIKILQARLVHSEDLKDFINEVRILFRLQHPNIVPLVDFGIEGDVPFLIMDYASNGTLRQPRGTRLPIDTVVTYVKQIAAALQFAHDRKLIHRDVKPDNILLGPANQVWLSDFGIASIAQSSRSLNTPEGVGTIAYMAPEQIMGKPRPASDQYALGIIVYEWLCGTRPFTGTATEIAIQHTQAPPPPLREKVPTILPVVEEVVMTALTKEPQKRFASIQALAKALEQASKDGQAASNLIPPKHSVPAPPVIPPSPVPSIQTKPIIEQRHSTEQPIAAAQTSSEPDRPLAIEPPRQFSPSTFPNPLPFVKTGQTYLPLTEAVLSGQKQARETNLFKTEHRTTSTISAPNRRIPRRKIAFFAGIVLLIVILSIAGIFYGISVYNTANLQASVRAYNTNVAANGTMFGFDAQHTHYNPYEKVIDATNVSRLEQGWMATTGAVIVSSPALVNNTVYIGSDDGKLYALNASGCGQSSCSPLWTADTGSTLISSPAVANGIIYISSDKGKLYAFGASGCGQLTCTPLWTTSIGNVTLAELILSSPIVANGIVYIGSEDGKLYAFNASGCGQSSCSPLWTADIGSPIVSSPAVSNDTVYIGSENHELYAFKASGCGHSSCSPLWTADTGYFILSSPAIANGVVYVGSEDHSLYAFNASGCGHSSCSPLWTAETGDSISSSPAIANGVIYIGSRDHKLYAFSASGCGQSSCSPLWTADTGDHILFSSPTVANGVIYIGSLNNKLYAFNASGCGQSSCSPLWTASTRGAIYSSPAVANGSVYVGSNDSKLYAFNIPGTTP